MSFIGPVPYFHPPALSMSTAVSQRQLFVLCPPLNIEGDAPAPPTLSVFSEKPVALNHSIPVVRMNPTHFLIAPQLPSPPAGFPCCTHLCRGSSAGLLASLPFWRSPCKNLWGKSEVFPHSFLKWQCSLILLCASGVRSLHPSNLI